MKPYAEMSRAIILCTLCLGSLNATAEACIPLDKLAEIEKWPICTLSHPTGKNTETPSIVSAASATLHCRMDPSTLAGELAITSLPEGTSEEKGCTTAHSTIDGKKYIAVKLPTLRPGPIWSTKSSEKGTSLQSVPAEMRGFELPAQPYIFTYGRLTGEIRASLLNKIKVNFGQARIKEINPTVPEFSISGLEIILPLKSQPKFSSLQITVANEYGQEEKLNLSFSPTREYSDSPTLQSLKIELAHIRKLAADEKFMRTRATESGYLDEADAKSIGDIYRNARASLPNCVSGPACGDLSQAQTATAKLIRADIDYRLFLLEKRITFWGGFRTLRPSTPHRELIKLRDLLQKFSSAHDRMEKWTFRRADKDGRAQELSAEKAYVQGQVKAENLTIEIKAIDTNRWNRLKASNAATKAAVESEISNVADRMDKLAAQQEALGKQATSQAMNAAASAAGIPVDVVAGVAEGDIKKAVVGYVTAELANPSSPLSTELQHFGDALVEANGTLANLQETYKDVKELQRNVDVVAVAIREPSMERFLKVGELAYSKMDGEQKRKIEQLIESQKPVQAWLQASYHQVVAIRGEIEGYRSALKTIAKEMNGLPKTFNAEARDFLQQELRKVGGQGKDAISGATARLLNGFKELPLKGRAAEQALVSVLAIYPTYISETNPNLWYSVKARHPGVSEEQLVAQFLSAANTSLAMSKGEREAFIRKTGFGFASDGKLVIENSGVLRSFEVGADIFSVARNIDPTRVPPLEIPKLESLLGLIQDTVPSDKLMIYVAATASAEGASAFLSRYVSKDRAPQMWANLKQVSGPLKSEVETGIRHAITASIASPGLPRPMVPPVPAGASIPGANAKEQMQSQMAAMALNAAFPGAGTAFQLAQTFASMDANRELNATLVQQSTQLISAYQELLRSSEDADFGESISRKEYDRAVALAEAAKAQLEQYNGAIDTILDSTRDADARLRLYRPYFFYLSEMLRQQFDLFDRSLAMWSGATDSRGFFATRIATDPSLARLALDSEIHLFDWLNRDREATKTDPFILFVHWQQLIALAESYCADHGCKPGDNVLGQIGTTDRIPLLQTLATPGTREQFIRWQQGPMNIPFTFRITLDPTRRLFFGHRLNVRNLDWNIVPVTKSGSIAGTHVDVRHMGHSQIPYEERYEGETIVRMRDESMLSTSFSPSNRKARFDSAALAQRFQTEMDLASLQPLRGLEGWGLYGAYEITVANNAAMREVEDFELEIAYIFADSRNVTSEQSFVATHVPSAEGCTSSDTGDRSGSPCKLIFYYTKGECGAPPRASSNRWVNPDAGLEYLYATTRNSTNQKMKLCRASATVPLAKRAADRQRATEQCSWASALAEVRNEERSAVGPMSTCKELSQ